MQRHAFLMMLGLGLAGCGSESVSLGRHEPEPDETYDPCAEKSCGELCDPCGPGNEGCTDIDELQRCDAEGRCVGETRSSCEGEGDGGSDEPSEYRPCEGQSCGAPCRRCSPEDPSCAESADVKACDGLGECVSDRSLLCESEIVGVDYEPCAGKLCGDACLACNPEDTSCVETSELKVCSPAGACLPAAQVGCGS
jgi:hypothetical protein